MSEEGSRACEVFLGHKTHKARFTTCDAKVYCRSDQLTFFTVKYCKMCMKITIQCNSQVFSIILYLKLVETMRSRRRFIRRVNYIFNRLKYFFKYSLTAKL